MRTGKIPSACGKKHTHRNKVAGMSHLLNRRYFHSSSGSFNSPSLFIRHHPPFQVTAEGSGSVRRQASQTWPRSCQQGTDRRPRPAKRGKSSSKCRTIYPLVTKKNPVRLLWRSRVRVVFTAFTDKLLIPFGRYFQRTFFTAANVTRAAIKSTKGALEKEKRGRKNVAATSENPVEKQTTEPERSPMGWRFDAPASHPSSPPLFPQKTQVAKSADSRLKKLIQLGRTSQQRHVESKRSGARRRRRPRRRRERARESASERQRETAREGKNPFLPLSVSPSSILSGHRAVPPF